MNQRTGQFYQCLPKELKNYILNNLMLSDIDIEILKTVMTHDAESKFYCDELGISDKKFNRHMLDIHDNVLREIIRLAMVGINAENA